MWHPLQDGAILPLHFLKSLHIRAASSVISWTSLIKENGPADMMIGNFAPDCIVNNMVGDPLWPANINGNKFSDLCIHL